MTDVSEKDMALQEIQSRVSQKDSDIAAIISELLQRFDDDLWPEAKRELNYELNGFSDSTEYYLKPPREPHHNGYMADATMYYRERKGKLAVKTPDGTFTEVKHQMGKQARFFVSTPIKRLQELSKQPGDEVVLDMPELTQLIGKEEGGSIVMICAQRDIQQMVEVMRRGIASVLHILRHPDTWDKMDAYLKLKQERNK